jgi:hypothetical protein
MSFIFTLNILAIKSLIRIRIKSRKFLGAKEFIRGTEGFF